MRVAPSDLRLKVLKDIAREHNVDWDSSSTEAEFRKKHEDLLVCIPYFFISTYCALHFAVSYLQRF